MLRIRRVNHYTPSHTIVNVGICEFSISSNPKVLATYSLGSCLAIVLYHSILKIGALIHTLLPEPRGDVDNPLKYVKTAIPLVLNELRKQGINRFNDLEAALIGGANILKATASLRIGEKNVKMAKRVLKYYGIEIRDEDVGGNRSRDVFFEISTGNIYVTSPKLSLISMTKLFGGGHA